MEPKIILYDSNDVKIGETFVRRARQLVKQQKAVWTDSTETALRFLPGMENSDTNLEDEPTSEPIASETKPQDEAWLVALAEKRLRARSLFIIHSVWLFPMWLLIFLFCAVFLHGFVAGFFLGALGASWGTAYLIHAYLFLKNNRRFRQSRDERKAKQLAAEVAVLKSELNM